MCATNAIYIPLNRLAKRRMKSYKCVSYRYKTLLERTLFFRFINQELKILAVHITKYEPNLATAHNMYVPTWMFNCLRINRISIT